MSEICGKLIKHCAGWRNLRFGSCEKQQNSSKNREKLYVVWDIFSKIEVHNGCYFAEDCTDLYSYISKSLQQQGLLRLIKLGAHISGKRDDRRKKGSMG